jgi:hypothetical protein
MRVSAECDLQTDITHIRAGVGGKGGIIISVHLAGHHSSRRDTFSRQWGYDHTDLHQTDDRRFSTKFPQKNPPPKADCIP